MRARIELDRTIFYPQGGGQQGDIGALVRANGERIAIADTRKGDALGQRAARRLAPARRRSKSARALTLELDWPRRYALMRLHTALHVMSCVVVAPVTGGNIAPDKARLDFDIDMSLLDAAKIERETNALIARGGRDGNGVDHRRGARRAAGARQDDERAAAARRGRVRLLRIPDIDLQPCGGTHVRNIGEIGAHPRAEDPQRRQAQPARRDRARRLKSSLANDKEGRHEGVRCS